MASEGWVEALRGALHLTTEGRGRTCRCGGGCRCEKAPVLGPGPFIAYSEPINSFNLLSADPST